MLLVFRKQIKHLFSRDTHANEGHNRSGPVVKLDKEINLVKADTNNV